MTWLARAKGLVEQEEDCRHICPLQPTDVDQFCASRGGPGLFPDYTSENPYCTSSYIACEEDGSGGPAFR